MSARLTVALALSFALAPVLASAPATNGRLKARRGGAAAPRLSPEDEAFLEDLSRRSFLYFREQAHPATGLVRDRARADGTPHPPAHNSHDIASAAATGFGLTAYCIA